MTKSAAVVALAIGLLLAGCYTPVPQPSGGDRAAGTVRMSYAPRFFGIVEYDKIDWEAAHSKAIEQCKAWGYTGAEAAGLGDTTWDGIIIASVNREYKCTGDLEK